MKCQTLAAAIASVFVGLSSQVLAQSKDSGSFTQGESKRCESMTGPSKDQCDKEEGSKTQGPAAQNPIKPQDSATSGSSATAKSDGSFTHGESKRCETMTGAAKDQCDKEEGAKTEGSAATKQ